MMSEPERQRDTDPDRVAEASKESFPASDSPASNAGTAGASSPKLDTIVAKGLLVTVEAREGRELEVENFLVGGVPLAELEDGAPAWFALRLGGRRYGIFSAFVGEDDRGAYLAGKAGQLLDGAGEFLTGPPRVEEIDVLASKLPKRAEPAGPA
jgi:hypothetical protein